MPAPLTADELRALARLRAGELVVIPTETVYGLAGDAENTAAVAAIFALKGRPPSRPLIVQIASSEARTPCERLARTRLITPRSRAPFSCGGSLRAPGRTPTERAFSDSPRHRRRWR